jgi:hypothetical protein
MKIAGVLVPKMGLAPSVLKKALPDLIAFGIVFAISLLAFSSIFHMQLGPVMLEYNTRLVAFISLSRALFGDFDVDDIINSSPSYVNAFLFLVYLFVAVFILLSMFLAILGEAQANLRDDQRMARKDGLVESEYGVLHTFGELVLKKSEWLPVIGKQLADIKAKEKAEEGTKQEQEMKRVTPVDRIEARQLEASDRIDEIVALLRTMEMQSIHRRHKSHRRDKELRQKLDYSPDDGSSATKSRPIRKIQSRAHTVGGGTSPDLHRSVNFSPPEDAAQPHTQSSASGMPPSEQTHGVLHELAA